MENTQGERGGEGGGQGDFYGGGQGDFYGGEFLVLFFVFCFVFCCLVDLRVGGGRAVVVDRLGLFFGFVCVMGMVGGGLSVTEEADPKKSTREKVWITEFSEP